MTGILRDLRALCVVLAGAGLPGASATLHAGPPSAHMDYRAPKSITLGEPAVMTVRLTNTTGYRLMADFGVDDQTKFVLRQTKPDGTTVKVEPSIPPPNRMRTSRLILRGASHTAFVVLDEWLSFSETGVYRVDVEFQGAVAIDGGNQANVKRTAQLTMVVKPRDPTRLEKRAAECLKQLSSLAPGLESRAAATALTLMKDPIAVPYLELAVTRTRSPQFADALAAMNTSDAREALERLARHRDGEIRALALKVLGREDGRLLRTSGAMP
jgi:hypothetical protein